MTDLIAGVFSYKGAASLLSGGIALCNVQRSLENVVLSHAVIYTVH